MVSEEWNIDYETVLGFLCLGAVFQKYLPDKVDYVIKHIIVAEKEAN